MNNSLFINLSRFGFIAVLLYEIFRWKFFRGQVVFTWEGLMLTIGLVWIAMEAIFYYLDKNKINFSPSSFLMAFFSLSLDAFGDMYGLYDSFSPWFDKIAHLTGGGVVAFIVYDILRNVRIRNQNSFSEKWLLVLTVAIAFLVGFGYEWIEYIEDVFYWGYQIRLGDAYDTIDDMQLNLLGSILAVSIFKKYKQK